MATACRFATLIELPDKVLWFNTAHNFFKTYYAPLLFRPLSFVRGLRLLFGDQSMSVGCTPKKGRKKETSGVYPTPAHLEDCLHLNCCNYCRFEP